MTGTNTLFLNRQEFKNDITDYDLENWEFEFHHYDYKLEHWVHGPIIKGKEVNTNKKYKNFKRFWEEQTMKKIGGQIGLPL